MRISSFFYLVKEGIKNIWINRMMSLASVGVLMACMLLMGVAIIFSLNIDRMMTNMEENNVVVAFVNDETELSDGELEIITSEIFALENISEAEFIHKDEGLESMIERMGEEFRPLFEEFGDNPLPHAVRATMIDLTQFDETVLRIQNIEGITHYRSSRDMAIILSTMRDVITTAGLWIIGMLALISLVIIATTINITVFNRRLEINIQRAVGATSAFVRFPFLVEGVILGGLAALFTTGVTHFVYRLAIDNLGDMLGVIQLNPVPFGDFYTTLLVVFAILGVSAGLIGSLISTGRYLRKEGSEFRAL